MHHHVRISAVAALLGIALVACSDSPTTPPANEGTNWAAQLSAEGDAEVTGTASVEGNDTEFTVVVEIIGGTEGAPHPWYVGEGATCGDLELRLGDAEAYPALEPDEEGEASAEATVDVALDPEEEYHVAVLASDEDETVVACGVLEVD